MFGINNKRSAKSWKRSLFGLVVVIGVILTISMFDIKMPYIGQSITFPIMLKTREQDFRTSKLKKILLWVPFFGREDYYFGLGHKAFLEHDCPVSKCDITTNRSELLSSNAVIFHYRDINLMDLPKYRPVWQRWVFYLMESPFFTYPDLKAVNGLFNWTMTYRRDSDVVASYARVIRKPAKVTQQQQNYTEILSNKTGMVVWIVSNCKTPGKRENYVYELKKYVPVDIFGNCGTHSCSAKECDENVYRRYKFYLSFENSVCVDYVTEKFYKTLDYHIVPVVYGGAKYSEVAPPHSYIDVRDFKSPRHLAEYLWSLHKNDKLYTEYFQWKTQYAVTDGSRSFCELCALINSVGLPIKWYEDINAWWMIRGNCTTL